MVEAVMGRAVSWLARYTGPSLIVLISACCGFVIGVALSTTPADP
ncbi:hypothetical protein [Streptomyces diastatochromogenes]|nr:hypothetical protein [Streptomyces diastatochromogenes]